MHDPHLDRLIALALEEDLGASGDVTTAACVPSEAQARGVVRAKESLVVAGLVAVERVFAIVDPSVRVTRVHQDGDEVPACETVATIDGPAHSLLVGERPALNFIMRLSGIATQARRIASVLAGTNTRVVDT